MTTNNSDPELPNVELATSGTIHSGLQEGCFTLLLIGDVRLVWCVALETYCERIFATETVERFFVDLRQSLNLDSTTLGVLAKLGMLCKTRLGVTAELSYASEDIERLIVSMSFKSVFEMLPADSVPDIAQKNLKPLQATDCGEAEIKQSVLDAHCTLSELSEENKNKFNELINTLKDK